jgi:hypothetical protein
MSSSIVCSVLCPLISVLEVVLLKPFAMVDDPQAMILAAISIFCALGAGFFFWKSRPRQTQRRASPPRIVLEQETPSQTQPSDHTFDNSQNHVFSGLNPIRTPPPGPAFGHLLGQVEQATPSPRHTQLTPYDRECEIGKHNRLNYPDSFQDHVQQGLFYKNGTPTPKRMRQVMERENRSRTPSSLDLSQAMGRGHSSPTPTPSRFGSGGVRNSGAAPGSRAARRPFA